MSTLLLVPTVLEVTTLNVTIATLVANIDYKTQGSIKIPTIVMNNGLYLGSPSSEELTIGDPFLERCMKYGPMMLIAPCVAYCVMVRCRVSRMTRLVSVLLLSDIMLAILLLPIGALVVLDSASPESALVNVVVVQVFAVVDEYLVTTILFEAKSLGSLLDVLVTNHPDSTFIKVPQAANSEAQAR